ncbi:MAG TPA: DegT/DnrJ/EryC1/StrS family aminotransferase [Myxococcales bacterium]|jgi:dTDP-4-amino-4,6-dideoxygalactose transaminase|nr:DegT/DnrJ/EryC1/StrS family aminotransferase [Myxococcales bacterium]
MAETFVTRTYLPPLEEYVERLRGIWERNQVTNHGPLVLELEEKLRKRMGAKHVFFVANGTIALQVALKALAVTGEVITTPFSYVASTSSIAWEGAVPVFADIDPRTLTIDVEQVERAINGRTRAVLATHVYGNPCDVLALEELCKRRGVKLIFDAAHAFDVRFAGRQLVTFGDVSALSFHATKLFHTIEGGAVVCDDDELAARIAYMRNFGHAGYEAFQGLGINGKNCELHAAMGLCLLPRVEEFIRERKALHAAYDLSMRGSLVVKPEIRAGADWNYSYYPILLPDEAALLRAREALNARKVFPRRYFYPALTSLPYPPKARVPVAEDVARRALCLPLFSGLPEALAAEIGRVVREAL